MPGFKLSFDEHTALQKDYATGKYHYTDLCEKYHIADSTFFRALKKTPQITRKYANRNLVTSYFHSIDTEEKAYWLGFILADGGVYKDRLQLACAVKDFDHLNKFMVEELCSSNKPYHTTSTDSYQFNVHSKSLIKDLRKLGIIERKTFKVKFPKISKALTHHFIRGYFDGDGSISFSITNKSPMFSILGTYAFLKELVTQANLPNKRILWNRSIRMIARCGKGACASFYQYLYKDATVFLERKKKRFEDYCGIK